jgi:hypothetical protein
MGKLVDVYGKKFFSLSLIFNSLLTVVYAIGILAGFYTILPKWKPYSPYIIDGALFWIIIPAAIINIFPAANIGKVKMGRLWFHHYVYGFLISASSATLLTTFTPASLTSLFMANITDAPINVGRFFILGGLTLLLDDLADVSKRLKRVLTCLKANACQKRRIMHAIQYLTSFIFAYFFVGISIYLIQNSAEATLANFILISTLLVTSLTSFGIARNKTWLKITTGKTEISPASEK